MLCAHQAFLAQQNASGNSSLSRMFGYSLVHTLNPKRADAHLHAAFLLLSGWVSKAPPPLLLGSYQRS